MHKLTCRYKRLNNPEKRNFKLTYTNVNAVQQLEMFECGLPAGLFCRIRLNQILALNYYLCFGTNIAMQHAAEGRKQNRS